MVLTSALAVLALLGASCAAEPPEVSSDDPQLVLGRTVYARNCASCHGADGRGGVGDELWKGATVEAYPDPADQEQLILDGRGRMPSFFGRLTEDEVTAVVRYTREVL